MLAALLIMQPFKLIFSRPRYRLVIQEIQGAEFQPWYLPFAGASEFIQETGIERNNFCSFPSGHALQCMGLIFSLPSLAEIYGCLKKRRVTLFAAGMVFAILVCISRMVMGAHFLSDVSMGSLMAILAAYVWFRLIRSGHMK